MINNIPTIIKEVMRGAGLECSAPIIPNGKIQRFGMSSDSNKKPCWYVVHIIFNDLVYVVFGCWKRGIYEAWCSKGINSLSTYDKELLRQAQDRIKNKQLVRQFEANKTIKNIWDRAESNIGHHAYLARKHIKSFGLRLYKGMLLVPLYNENNELSSLQFITSNGDKWFKKDANTNGCFFVIGEPSKIICIAEGYATAASIYQATGHAVAVAFNANNLLPVAKVLRKKYPAHEIIICADNDAFGGAQ